MKKNIISIFVFFIALLTSISIILVSNANNKENFEIDKEKIHYEIKYFDLQIISMLNLLNNIDETGNLNINWSELQKQTINMYSYWNTVILDLNYLEIDKNTLIDFGKNIDNLALGIRNNDKNLTIMNLLEMYKKLTIYSEVLNYNEYNSILITKYNLLIASSAIESQNWTLVYEYVTKASDKIYEMLKNNENKKYNQYNINQAYVSIKELENLINIRDIDIFYIKYNIAMQKLENI